MPWTQWVLNLVYLQSAYNGLWLGAFWTSSTTFFPPRASPLKQPWCESKSSERNLVWNNSVRINRCRPLNI